MCVALSSQVYVCGEEGRGGGGGRGGHHGWDHILKSPQGRGEGGGREGGVKQGCGGCEADMCEVVRV